jgi:hypothetical protein
MLAIQFQDSLGAPTFHGTGLGSYDPATIKALQNALIKAGKNVKASGVMDGATAAAIYEIIRDRGGAFASAIASQASQTVASKIQSAFKVLQDMDATLAKVPVISLSIPSLLRDTSKISLISSIAVEGVCSPYASKLYSNAGPESALCAKVKSIANTIQNAINTFFRELSEAAPTLLKVIGILVPGSVSPSDLAPPTTTPPTKYDLTVVGPVEFFRPPSTQPPSTQPPKYPAGSIQWRSRKDLMWHVAVPVTAAFGEVLEAAAPYVERDVLPEAAPGVRIVDETEGQKATGQLPFYKNWKFWAAVGGVAALGGGSYFLIRRKRSA